MKQLLVPILLVVNLGVSGAVLALALTGQIVAPAPPGEGEMVEETPKQAFYYELKPELTVNFSGSGRPRYMQLALTAVTYDEAALPELERHKPAIHNALLLLFSGVEPEPLTTREGKEKLLAAGLETMRTIMKERYGKETVEDLYFTRFVMQ